MNRRWGQGVAVVAVGLVVGLTPGEGGQTLRLALGPGLGTTLVGASLGWVLAGVGHLTGDPLHRLTSRTAVALLALPPLALGPLLARSSLPGLLGALLWMRTWQSAVLLLEQARALGSERFVEAAVALGARPGRIYWRQLGPWLLPSALALGIEGAVLVAPLELMFGLVGSGSAQLGAPVAAALERGDRGPLLAASAASAVVAMALMTLAGRVRRWASNHEDEG